MPWQAVRVRAEHADAADEHVCSYRAARCPTVRSGACWECPCPASRPRSPQPGLPGNSPLGPGSSRRKRFTSVYGRLENSTPTSGPVARVAHAGREILLDDELRRARGERVAVAAQVARRARLADRAADGADAALDERVALAARAARDIPHARARIPPGPRPRPSRRGSTFTALLTACAMIVCTSSSVSCGGGSAARVTASRDEGGEQQRNGEAESSHEQGTVVTQGRGARQT